MKARSSEEGKDFKLRHDVHPRLSFASILSWGGRQYASIVAMRSVHSNNKKTQVDETTLQGNRL